MQSAGAEWGVPSGGRVVENHGFSCPRSQVRILCPQNGTGFAAKPGGSRHGGMEVTEQGHPLGGGDGAVTVRAGPVLHAREMTKTKRVDRRRIGSRISQGLPIIYGAYRVEVEWLKTTDSPAQGHRFESCVHKIGTGFAAKPGGSRHGGMEVTEQGHPLGGGDGAVTVRAGPVLHAREMTKTKRVDRRRIGSRISQGLPRG